MKCRWTHRADPCRTYGEGGGAGPGVGHSHSGSIRKGCQGLMHDGQRVGGIEPQLLLWRHR